MKRILGLDLGTNSIGWSLIENDFDIKEGEIKGIKKYLYFLSCLMSSPEIWLQVKINIYADKNKNNFPQEKYPQ